MSDENVSSRLDQVAAIDASQQQLRAAADATLEEHLRLVAQVRVDEELDALRASGVRDTSGQSFLVTVRRDR